MGGMMFAELRALVGNERGFVHKKLLGGLSKLSGLLPIPAFASTLVGSLAGRLAGRGRAPVQPGRRFRRQPTELLTRARTDLFRPGPFDPAPVVRPPPRRTLPRTITARPTLSSAVEKENGKKLKFPDFVEDIIDVGERIFGGGGRKIPLPTLPGVIPGLAPDCDPPLVRGPSGLCIAPTSPLGASRLVGEAVMGQYGAALVPGSQIVDRATCLRGMQLGNDGLCYNKSQISNKQRMWPAGRKPLLSGGDMRAISTAARAGRRMELATKRLQKMGMMRKPVSRRGAPRGHVARLEHASQH